MAYTTIDDPEAYFQASAYTGNGTAIGSGGLAVTLDGDTDMQPDMVFFCNLGTTQSRNIHDSVRGVTETLYPDSTAAEYDNNETLTTFGSDGFTVGSDNSVNQSSQTISAWCWKESATAGFDIVSYTGNGSARTISHSLSAVPHFFITKCRSAADLSWKVYHQKNTSAPETDSLTLQGTGATDDDAGYYNDTAPTSSVFSLGTSNDLNDDGETYIGYFWSEKQGFSSFKSYTGNGNADGPFIYTGFRPAWVMTKLSSASGEGWVIRDNKRNPFNVAAKHTRADGNAVESTSTGIYADFLSNGFKIRGTDAAVNTDDATYIYMAFAEAPFVNSKGVPCNAR